MSRKPHLISLILVFVLTLAACVEATPTLTVKPKDTPTAAPSPTAPPPVSEATAPGTDLEGFVVQMIQAFDARNFDQLQAMMGDPFVFGFWRGEGVTYTPAEAIEQLRTNYIGPDTQLVFDRDVDLAPILGGSDPESFANPEVDIVEMFFVDGWGLEGNDEAIIFIAQRSDGSLYWHSVLIAMGGFSGQ